VKLKTRDDDVVLYQPYQDSTKPEEEAALQFIRAVSHYIPQIHVDEDTENGVEDPDGTPLRAVQMSSGLATVFVPGKSPRIIIKTAACDPKTIGISQSYLHCVAGCTSEQGGDKVLTIDNEVFLLP
jgi:hypothetical protein